MYKKLFIGLILLINTPAFAGISVDNAYREIVGALRKGDSKYFAQVTYETLQKGNRMSSSGFTLLNRAKYRFTPALLGGFANSDAKIRKLVYRALQFPYYSKKYNRNPKDVLKIKNAWKNYLFSITARAYRQTETDKNAEQELFRLRKTYHFQLKDALFDGNYKAIATLDSNQFRQQNQGGVVASLGKITIAPLIMSLGESYCSPETGQAIIEELKYKSLGGPKKLLQGKQVDKQKLQTIQQKLLSYSEKLFLIADKQKNKKVKQSIVALAALYYPN